MRLKPAPILITNAIGFDTSLGWMHVDTLAHRASGIDDTRSLPFRFLEVIEVVDKQLTQRSVDILTHFAWSLNCRVIGEWIPVPGLRTHFSAPVEYEKTDRRLRGVNKHYIDFDDCTIRGACSETSLRESPIPSCNRSTIRSARYFNPSPRLKPGVSSELLR